MNQIESKADVGSASERPKARTDNMPPKITAHAVRGFRPCIYCNGIGHRDYMIAVDGGHIHTSCYMERDGFEASLKLPAADMAKFRLCDMTKAHMQKFSRAWNKKADR